MKKLSIPFIFAILLSNGASAQEQNSTQYLFSADSQNPYTQVCLAALISKRAERSKARELGIGTNERNRIQCNDASLIEFAKIYAGQIDYSNIATVE